MTSLATQPLKTHAADEGWLVKKVGNQQQIFYGSGSDFPQYGVIHLDSGYFRLNWGISFCRSGDPLATEQKQVNNGSSHRPF